MGPVANYTALPCAGQTCTALGRLDLLVVTLQPQSKRMDYNPPTPCLLQDSSSAPSPEEEERKVDVASPSLHLAKDSGPASIYLHLRSMGPWIRSREDCKAEFTTTTTTNGNRTTKLSVSNSLVLPSDRLAGARAAHGKFHHTGK